MYENSYPVRYYCRIWVGQFVHYVGLLVDVVVVHSISRHCLVSAQLYEERNLLVLFTKLDTQKPFLLNQKFNEGSLQSRVMLIHYIAYHFLGSEVRRDTKKLKISSYMQVQYLLRLQFRNKYFKAENFTLVYITLFNRDQFSRMLAIWVQSLRSR